MSYKYCRGATGQLAETEVLARKYHLDHSKFKVNLGIEGFLSELGNTWSLPVVRNAEKAISNLSDEDELNDAFGNTTFIDLYSQLLLGSKECDAVTENRVLFLQTVSICSSLSILGIFLTRIMKYKIIYIPLETWVHYRRAFMHAGFIVKCFRYWDKKANALDISGILEDLQKMPENSIIFFYCCAHFPTGCDPSKDQWHMIADIIEERNLLLILDCVFIGFKTGDVDADAWALRYLINREIEFFVVSSACWQFCAHSYSLGFLGVIVNQSECIPKIKSHLKYLIRYMYGKPANIGPKLIGSILSDEQLFEQWKQNIFAIAVRLMMVRIMLKEHLEKSKVPGNWSFITEQSGMYVQTNFCKTQISHLYRKHHIYMYVAGLINISAINRNNVRYIVDAINETYKYVKCYS